MGMAWRITTVPKCLFSPSLKSLTLCPSSLRLQARFSTVFYMLGTILKKIIGSKNDREVKKIRSIVAKANEFEAGLQSLSDDALRQKTADWKARFSTIQDNTELATALME